MPRLKHLRKTVLQHELFPNEAHGNIKNLLKKYEDFKDLRLSSKKIVNRDNRKVTPSVDNWIKDYVHYLGASNHDSLQRSKYFSNNQNILDLNNEEKTSLIRFFDSYDKDNIVNIINNGSVLTVAEYIEKKKEVKEEINIDNILEQLKQDLLDLEKDILAEEYILSEVDNRIMKVGDLLWDSLGLGDSNKALGCLRVLIKKKRLDRLIKEDKRLQSVMKRFLTIRYGNGVAHSFVKEGPLLKRRLFLEMILVDKLKIKEPTIMAYYLTHLIKRSGQVVYLDEADGILKWREVQVIKDNLSWVT